MGCCKSNDNLKNSKLYSIEKEEENKKTDNAKKNYDLNNTNEGNNNKSEEEINNSSDNISDKMNSEEIDEINEDDDNISNDSAKKEFENIIKKNILSFIIAFGPNFNEIYFKFLKASNTFFEFSSGLRTTFYTLSFEKVKNIIENLKNENEKTFIISDKFYNLVVNNEKKIKNLNRSEDIYEVKGKLFLDLIDLQIEIIISIIRIFMLSEEFNFDYMTYSCIKYFQDFGFCIKYFMYSLTDILYGDEFLGYEYHLDIRILYFLTMMENLTYNSQFPSDLLKLATESAKIKDTIILGDKQFRNHIMSLNLPSKRINELDDNMLELFFKKPYKEENKYKITKYFVICEESVEQKYLEKFKLLSSKYGFAYLFIIYLKNKKISDIRNSIIIEKSIIYIFEDYELIEIYKENNEILKPGLIYYLLSNDSLYYKCFKKFNLLKESIYNDMKNFKSNCEDGWELFEPKNFGQLVINLCSFHDFVKQVFVNIMNSYKEHNSLEIFFKYYSNYFFLTLQPEFIVNMTAYAKMFLYAYTLEERDPHKNLYCIINKDLRSSDPKKNSNYLDLVKLIGGLVKTKRLKCFTGKVYRATFLKDELVNKIKIGLSMTNSAFWSSSKKLSVAKKFLKQNYKNTLIITKGGLNNNVDIHLEGISKYNKEEEVLFLPFCKFTIKSFEKVNENNLNYYKLILENESESSTIEPFSDPIIKNLNQEKGGLFW